VRRARKALKRRKEKSLFPSEQSIIVLYAYLYNAILNLNMEMNNGFEESRPRGWSEGKRLFCGAHAIEIKNEFRFCVMLFRGGKSGGGGETNGKSHKGGRRQAFLAAQTRSWGREGFYAQDLCLMLQNFCGFLEPFFAVEIVWFRAFPP
jgi:hypothetical protein